MPSVEETAAKPNARMQVLDVPVAAPGKCVVCGFGGREDDRKYIDFGFDLDYYGVVYFCSSCFTEVAGQLGYISESKWTAIVKENMLLSDQCEEMRRERDGSINALRTYLNGGSVVGAVAESEELPKPVSTSKRPAPKKSGPKPALSSVTKQQGPNDSGDSDGDTISLD